MRKKRLAKNTILSLLLQLTTLICSFILPRLILLKYGSDVNGVISSITQFLQAISLLELGMGAVIQSALYKPLAENNKLKINRIVTSGTRFFKIVARILVWYIVILLIVYPFLSSVNESWLFVDSLIVVMSISTFAQYYFGIVDRLLLNADQKGYIQYSVQIITLIANTIICVVLILCGFSIQVVKLSTSLIFLARPAAVRWYINKHYNINRNENYDVEPITQKWNGVAQHFASYILDGTDIIVLTFMGTMGDVSIYSVYNMIIVGIKQLFLSLTTGVHSLIGELWAKEEIDKLTSVFDRFEFLIHTFVVIIFGCTSVLIEPFVSVYTKGITDVNYHVVVFGILLTLANGLHCLRLPYNILILSAGHYKTTQSNYIVAALLNITISIICVYRYGLIGVTIGTVIAMTYQTVWMAIYDSKNIIKWNIRYFIKHILIDFIVVFISYFISHFISLQRLTYYAWFIMAIKVFGIWTVVSFIVNYVFYKNHIYKAIYKILYSFLQLRLVKRC